MRSKRFVTEGVVLSTRNYSEADRIITVFTKDFGKITVLAKGVRKPKSRKGRNIEVFGRVKIAVSKAKGFDILTEVELIEGFSVIRSDLKRTSVSYFFVDTVSSITDEWEENIQLYIHLIKYLRGLEKDRRLKTIRKKFTQGVLEISGFWPEGKEITDPDGVLQEIVEKEIKSIKVGRKLQDI